MHELHQSVSDDTGLLEVWWLVLIHGSLFQNANEWRYKKWYNIAWGWIAYCILKTYFSPLWMRKCFLKMLNIIYYKSNYAHFRRDNWFWYIARKYFQMLMSEDARSNMIKPGGTDCQLGVSLDFSLRDREPRASCAMCDSSTYLPSSVIFSKARGFLIITQR